MPPFPFPIFGQRPIRKSNFPLRHFTYVRSKVNLVPLACEDDEYLGRGVKGGGGGGGGEGKQG